MKETKEFFNPILFNAGMDLTKKWFVYYYEPLVNGHVPKRIKVYKGINRIKTIEGRLKKAKQISAQIKKSKTLKYSQVIKEPQVKNEILTDTLESMKNYVDPKTIMTYAGMVAKFHVFIGSKTDSQVTREDARAFIDFLFDKHLSPKTVKAYRNGIKTLYNKYIDRYEPEGFKNPFRKMPVIKTSSRSLMYFSNIQIQKIKEHCKSVNPLLWLACQLQFYCFIRPNELRQLKVEYVNLNGGYIEIPGFVSKNRKTQKVSIPSALLPDLNFLAGHDPDLFIFSGPGPIALPRDRLSKWHKKVLDELNIKGRYGFYSWKHTGVVAAYKAGIDMKDLQMQLRHHSLDMVNEYLKDLGIMDSDRIRNLFPKI